MKKIIIIVFIVLAIGIAAFGYRLIRQTNIDHDEQKYTLLGAHDDYAQAKAHLTLPEGINFPPIFKDSGKDTIYGEGVGLIQAQSFWKCAWEKEWLEQKGKDQVREEKALMILSKDVPASKFMTQYLDEQGRKIYKEYLTKAQQGDPSGIQEEVSNNCSGTGK